jgi:lysyl-tRNA synthetase class 2
MRRAARLCVLAVAPFAGLAVLLAATGWLYVARPRATLFGPKIGEALPLDELSRHSSVPLVLFVGVWAVAALVLGLLARLVRLGRLTAALVLALGVGIWLYLETAVSIAVVRQIPAEDAFRAAGELRAVYLPAVLAGLGGALLAVGRRAASPRAPLVLGWLVAAAGVLGAIDAILPQRHRTLLCDLIPKAHVVAHALAAPLGLALVYTAFGLARGLRRAWALALGLLLGSTVLHVLHSDLGAIWTGALALALVARRQSFTAPGDPTGRPRLIGRALLFAAVVYAYGAIALVVNRVDADRPVTAGFIVSETSRALLGLGIGGSAALSTGIGHWFALSVLILGLAAAASLLHGWLAPWRYRVRQEARERDRARELVAAWGVDTLAPFVLRADKSYFFADGESAFLAYRVVGGVALVSGDPIGPPEAFDELVARFIAFAHERSWRITVLGASEANLGLYRRHGLRALYHGDEAVVEAASFSLDGRAIRKVRQSVNRLAGAGYSVEVLRPREIGPRLRGQLESIARAWRGSEPERGFVMALDELFRLEDDDAVFVVGRGPDGAPAGFLHFAVCHAAAALSLSSMPRLRTTPNGFNEWLICEALAWAREQGFARVSLNFSPFAELLAPEAQPSGIQRLERRALLVLKGRFQLDNLLLFNRKFFPSWQRRFVVYERVRDLPRIGVAALAAEAYLPFSGRGRR